MDENDLVERFGQLLAIRLEWLLLNLPDTDPSGVAAKPSLDRIRKWMKEQYDNQGGND